MARQTTAPATARAYDYERQESRFGLALILPAVLFVALVVLVPMVSVVMISFSNQRSVTDEFTFVGLSQYESLLANPDFLPSIWRSVVWVIANAALQTVLALGVGLLLNNQFRGQGFVRSWIILPWIVPAAVIAILWKWILNATIGSVNTLLLGIGVIDDPIVFLSSTTLAFPTLVFINSWRLFPFMTLIVLAALQGIPPEEYEAARVDGASRRSVFRAITWPYLGSTLTVLGLVGTLWAANLFDLIWLLTRGGPVQATTTAPVFIYQEAFNAFDIASAAAASVMFLLVLAAFATVFVILNRRQLGLFESSVSEEGGR
jgi:multiple sugar transport system permease protein